MARFAAPLYEVGINRCVDVPQRISGALGTSSRAARRFSKLPPATQREIVRWLATARQGATRERRIEVVLERLEAGRLREKS